MTDINESLDILPKEPAYILANHILDDMMISLMAENLSPLRKKEVLGWSTHNGTYALETGNAFKMEWNNLLTNTQKLEDIKNHIKKCWVAIIETLTPKCLILSQYPSATLHENGLDSLNKHAEQIFRDLCFAYSYNCEDNSFLQPILNKIKNYNEPHLGKHILNAEYWMVYKRK